MSGDPQRRAEAEAALRAIADVGRRTRTRAPRWLWVLALGMAAVGAVGFAVVMFAEPAASTSETALRARPIAGSGLGIGLGVGCVVGVLIGLAIARQRADHSSRNTP